MLAHSHVCPRCRIQIEASDLATLDWGVSTHVCEAKDPEGMAVVDWLVAQYGEPFWFVRAGGVRVLVC